MSLSAFYLYLGSTWTWLLLLYIANTHFASILGSILILTSHFLLYLLSTPLFLFYFLQSVLQTCFYFREILLWLAPYAGETGRPGYSSNCLPRGFLLVRDKDKDKDKDGDWDEDEDVITWQTVHCSLSLQLYQSMLLTIVILFSLHL